MIKIGDVKETIYRSIQIRGISSEDADAMQRHNLVDERYSCSFKVLEDDLDELLEIIQNSQTAGQVIFTQEFITAVEPWLRLGGPDTLNEIHFIINTGACAEMCE